MTVSCRPRRRSAPRGLRYDRFMQAQAAISAARLESKIGRTIDVLIDEVDAKGAVGRSSADAPEIDGLVYLDGFSEAEPGQFIQAEVIEAVALETSGIVEKPLRDISFPKGAMVAGIIHGETIIIPSGDSVIQPDDRVIIFARKDAISKIEKILSVKVEYF